MQPDSRADRDYYIERERQWYGSLREYSGDYGWPCATPPPIVPQAVVYAEPAPLGHFGGCLCDDICKAAARRMGRRTTGWAAGGDD